MKYSIMGFQQDKLIASELDVVDALILRMIKDMYSTSTMEFIVQDGTKYMWINYSYFFNELPIIGSKRNLMRRIERYGNELYILRLLKHSRKGVKGNFSYIAPTEKLDNLQDFDLMTKTHKGYDTNDTRVKTKSRNKDSSIKDSSTKDYKTYSDHEGLNTAFNEFIEHREQIKKPMSSLAITKMVNRVNAFNCDIPLKIEAINTAIERGWQGVFEPKGNNQQQSDTLKGATGSPNPIKRAEPW